MKMNLSFFILVSLICFSAVSQGTRYQWGWAQEANSSNYQVVNDVVVDKSRGWVYTVGGFEDNLSANYGGETSNGGKDGFVSKFDTIGNLLWSFDIGGNEDDEILGIDIDKSNGDIYIVGYGGSSSFSFVGTNGVNVLGDNIPKGGIDVIFAKYNSNGELIWYFRDGGNGDDYGRDIKVDLASNKFVYTGDFHSRMELNSTTIDMGPNDNKQHMFLGCRRKTDGNGIWRAYSENGEFEKGVALTYDDTYFYLVGDYEGDFNIVIEDGINFSNTYYSSNIDRGLTHGVNIFYGRFKKNDGSMEVPLQAASWLYPIYGQFSDHAGDIQIKGNKLYIGGSASNFIHYHQQNEAGIVGNEAFISIHEVLTGNFSSRIREPNIGATSKSIVNSISFTEDYLVAGGSTSGTIQFGGNPSNNLVANGSKDGFVSFYELGTNAFVEVHEVDGSGDNQVLATASKGKDVFVCGRFGFAAGLDSDIQMTGLDNETGFVSLISHRLCKPRIEYASGSICSESPVMLPSLIQDTLDIFSQLGSGLALNSVTGEIDPFTSLAGNHKIIHETYSGCADTVELEIVAGGNPTFTTVPPDVVIYSTDSDCGMTESYVVPTYAIDCGVNNMTKIDGSGYSSGSIFPVGVTEQVFVVSDGYNDNDTCRFTITVLDTISPDIICPQDDTIYTTMAVCGAVVNLVASATDNCGIDSVYQSGNLTYLVGETFPASVTPYEVEFTAVDINSQISTCSFNVLVRDIIPPVIVNCPSADIVAYAGNNDCFVAVDYGNLTGTDVCGGIAENLIGLPTNSIFPIDTTTIIYTVLDAFSNSSTCQFDVIVLDTVSPKITCPTDTLRYYVGSNSCTQNVVFTSPIATDNCLYRIEQVSGVASGTSQNLGLNYHLAFKATDSSGNFSTCRLRYEVIDSVSPVFVNCPSNQMLSADIQLCGSVFTFDSIGANDNCSLYFPTGSNYAMQTDLSGLSSRDTFPVGTTVLTFVQQDVSGNTSTCSFSIQVNNIESSSFNNNIPNGVCASSDSIGLFNAIDGNNSGSFYVNGVLTPTNYYTPPDNDVIDSIMYIIGDNGCQDTIEHIISIHDFNADAGVDSISLCGLDVDLKAITEQGASHSWTYSSGAYFLPNDTVDSPNILVNEEGEYWFFWNIQIDQCHKKDSVFVHFYEQPISNAGANVTVDESQVYLNAISVSGSGIWTAENSEGVIDDSSSYNTLVSDLNLGLNTFQWTVSNGPCLLDSSTVRVFYNLLTIPNAFTPNGDGVNDVFEIKGFNLYSDAEITIIDRWGEQLFLSDDSVSFWDGKYQNKDVVEDTYFYILFINGLEYTGYIELRR